MTRMNWPGLFGAAALALTGAGVAVAADQGKPHEQHQKGGGGGPDKGGGGDKGPGKAKHEHKNHSGKSLLGDKLKVNGKHAVGKFKDKTVTAEVKDGKVVNMAAGDLAPKRVKSKTKMAALDFGAASVLRATWNPAEAGGLLQRVQYDDWYYGYCFDDGIDFDCYWYPADEVDYADYTWDEYDPYY